MRKTLLTAIAGLICVLLAVGCGSGAPPLTSPHAARSSQHAVSPSRSGPPPNFVFVLTDDLSWNLVSHMPHVMGLEKAGTRMTRYYVVDSLCCPSRSAIFTGEYPHDDGVYTNTGSDGGYAAYNANGDQSRSFAVALQKAGYRTAMMGKYLNGYQPKKNKPAPGWNVWDVAGAGYNEFNYALNQNGTLHHYGHKAKDYLTDVIASKATSFIGSSASSGKPFMLEVATFAPHRPYTPAPRYAKTDRNIAYPRTPAYNKLPVNPPSWLKGRRPLSAAEQRKIRYDYRLRVEADLSVDNMIGNLEKELKAKGVAKNTYFVFSSDNGLHMGEYRLGPGK